MDCHFLSYYLGFVEAENKIIFDNDKVSVEVVVAQAILATIMGELLECGQ